eukprot:scaffold42931_cov69-Phaeocystis_antarctica.AAC.8
MRPWLRVGPKVRSACESTTKNTEARAESAIFSRSGSVLMCETVCIVSRMPPTAQTIVSTMAPGPHDPLPGEPHWPSPFTNRRGGVTGRTRSRTPGTAACSITARGCAPVALWIQIIYAGLQCSTPCGTGNMKLTGGEFFFCALSRTPIHTPIKPVGVVKTRRESAFSMLQCSTHLEGGNIQANDG